MIMENKELVKSYGLKATPTRLSVLAALQKYSKPVSVFDILKNLNKNTDQTTVYRILNVFVEKGMIKKIDLKKDFSFFEINEGKHHHHLVCQSCSKIKEIESCDISAIEKQVLKKSGFKSIDEHALEFYGLCENCA
ncbi:MAG: ferric uptake regulator, Fur family [Candidatus Doudnabacteria bacterium]|nr:ferric uptake regulator, Fur family [Candidatus Doudnabacteria bacterium]